MSVKFLNSYTFKQYKECYQDLLEHHKLEYEDHNEYTFIIRELESFYDGIIDIENIEELPFQFQFLKSYTDEQLSEALVNQIEFKQAAIKSNLSYSMIIEYLNQRKQELEKESNKKVAPPEDIDSRILTTNQRALIMVYNDNTIVTRMEHGNDLYNKFTKWVKAKTRTADPDTTKLVLENKIKLFESVIPFLLQENKQKAIDEIKALKLHLLKY